MKQLITRAQEFGRRAAELRQAAQQLPAQAAQLRQAVTMTGGELKQIGADIQSQLYSLRAEDEDRLLRAMRELSDNTPTIRQAGYVISGMDLDLAVNQRLAVHLEKCEDVPHQTIRALLARQSFDTVRSVLGGVMKAEETAANVELSNLFYQGVIVHIGLVPAIRLIWRTVQVEATYPLSPNLGVTQPVPPAANPASPGTASMFDLRPLPGGSVRIESKPLPSATPNLPTEPAASPAAAPAASWSHDALARFKQMPGASKYSR